MWLQSTQNLRVAGSGSSDVFHSLPVNKLFLKIFQPVLIQGSRWKHFQLYGIADSTKQTQKSSESFLCEAMLSLPYMVLFPALPFISQIQKLDGLMYNSKAKEISRVRHCVFMRVLKRNVIRELIELRRE